MGAQWKHAGRLATSSAKSKAFSKVAKELIVAAKGGADPGHNAKLRMAIEAAKKVSLPRETIERCIKRGSGQLEDAAQFETLTFEGFAPHHVPVIVECLTDNKNRTAPNIRAHFRKGQLAAAGAVSWDFAHLGMIEAAPPAAGADAETAAIEAGAQDFEPADEPAVRFFTEPGDVDTVGKALAAAGWNIESQRLGWRAKNPVAVSDEAARTEIEAFLAELDDDDDVQHIYVGLTS